MADDDAPETGTDTQTPSRLPDDHPLVKAYQATKADLASTKGKVKEFEDADKSEQQKLQDAIAEKDQQLATLPATVRKQAIRFASLASTSGFIDPEDALLGIGDVDLSDEDAVKAALEKLAERKPHLVRQETKRKVGERPKPKKGEEAGGDDDGGVKGKARAAAALRDFRKTR